MKTINDVLLISVVGSGAITAIFIITSVIAGVCKARYNEKHGHLCRNCGRHDKDGYCILKGEERGNSESCIRWIRSDTTNGRYTETDGEDHAD